MESSAIADWSDFFVTAAGAASALAGLVFVSLSINLARIIELPGVAGRAAETIILLAGTLAGTLLALIPHLSPERLGAILLVVTLSNWLPKGEVRLLPNGAEMLHLVGAELILEAR
jgi:hypothetical protein